jgi:cytolysin-activating lysine-acyltransferase
MRAVKWKSGAMMRIVDLVAPFGGEAEMREQIGSLQ